MTYFKINNLGHVPGIILQFYSRVVKGLKVKAIKFLGLIPAFKKVTGEKMVGTFLVFSGIFSRLKCLSCCEIRSPVFISVGKTYGIVIKNLHGLTFLRKTLANVLKLDR